VYSETSRRETTNQVLAAVTHLIQQL
jgi:hypothetical protein